MRRAVTAAIVIALLLVPSRVLADDVPELAPPHLRLVTGDGELRGPNGKLYVIPQGSHIVTGEVWDERELTLTGLQSDKVRLEAENLSMRRTTDDWQPGWRTLALTLASGIAAGWYIHSKF
jgi:hypothetical protein